MVLVPNMDWNSLNLSLCGWAFLMDRRKNVPWFCCSRKHTPFSRMSVGVDMSLSWPSKLGGQATLSHTGLQTSHHKSWSWNTGTCCRLSNSQQIPSCDQPESVTMEKWLWGWNTQRLFNNWCNNLGSKWTFLFNWLPHGQCSDVLYSLCMWWHCSLWTHPASQRPLGCSRHVDGLQLTQSQ